MCLSMHMINLYLGWRVWVPCCYTGNGRAREEMVEFLQLPGNLESLRGDWGGRRHGRAYYCFQFDPTMSENFGMHIIFT